MLPDWVLQILLVAANLGVLALIIFATRKLGALRARLKRPRKQP